MLSSACWWHEEEIEIIFNAIPIYLWEYWNGYKKGQAQNL